MNQIIMNERQMAHLQNKVDEAIRYLYAELGILDAGGEMDRTGGVGFTMPYHLADFFLEQLPDRVKRYVDYFTPDPNLNSADARTFYLGEVVRRIREIGGTYSSSMFSSSQDTGEVLLKIAYDLEAKISSS